MYSNNKFFFRNLIFLKIRTHLTLLVRKFLVNGEFFFFFSNLFLFVKLLNIAPPSLN